MNVIYGLVADSDTPETATKIAGVLDGIATEDDFDWVLWVLNGSTYAILASTLEVKGKATNRSEFDVITIGEASEAAMDNRSKWIVPRKKSSGSQQEQAIAKIKHLLNTGIGGNLEIEDNSTEHQMAQKVVLAPIKRKRLAVNSEPVEHPKPEIRTAQPVAKEAPRTSRRKPV